MFGGFYFGQSQIGGFVVAVIPATPAGRTFVIVAESRVLTVEASTPPED